MEAQAQLFNFINDNQTLKRNREKSHKWTNINIYPSLAHIHIYNIIFPKKTKSINNKMIVFNKSVQKILKLANVDKEDIFSYILFYLNEINLEAVGENKNLYNINYNNLLNIINYVHINYKNNDIKIHISSLKKIIDLCGLIREEKIKYMNFQGLEEKNETSFDYENKSSLLNNNNKDSNSKAIDILKEKVNEFMKKELNSDAEFNNIDNDLLKNNRYNTNYILDSDEENYENNLLERSYNILRAKNGNNLNQINNMNSNDTRDGANLNTLDTFNENNLSISLNDNNIHNSNSSKQNSNSNSNRTKAIKKKKRQKKIRKSQTFYEITSTSSFTYMGSTTSLTKISEEKEKEPQLIYPFNGYTKLKESLTIQKQIINNVQINFNNNKQSNDDDYCFYPFILRKTPELENKILFLSGSITKLGVWDPLRAIKMDEEERNGEKFFTKYIEIFKKEIPFEYKYFYYDGEKIKWLGEPFQNHITFLEFFDYLRTLKKSHISIMNINVRYMNKVDGINIWENRRSKLIQLLLSKTADVFFFQEITRPQSNFIDKYLSSIYEFVGDYRDTSISSEKCSICVNKLKYTIIHSGQFWLSSTPNIPGSNDYGNFFPRICTWASFKQIDGISLLFMNVHLDHANKRAHLPCIKIVLEEEQKIENQYNDIKFVFIGGCFYCEENDEEINYIKNEGYNEIKFENTYHGFTGKAENHWDYMFWKEKRGEDIELKDVEVLKKEATIDQDKKFYVSDHFPVYAEFYHKNKS